jgi:hypothetical protein
MTYIADRHNANLTRETTQWVWGDYTITKVSAWAVPDGVHADLGLPGHLDLYLASTGDWCADFDEAVAICQSEDSYSDRVSDDANQEIEAEIDDYRSDLLDAAICAELEMTVFELNPDRDYVASDSPTWEIRKRDVRIGYVRGTDGCYQLAERESRHQGGRDNVYSTLKAAAIALLEIYQPSEVLLALALAQ